MNIDPNAWYTEQEVSDYFRWSVSTTQKARVKGNGLPFAKFGPLVRYKGRHMLDHAEACMRSSTSDTGKKAA